MTDSSSIQDCISVIASLTGQIIYDHNLVTDQLEWRGAIGQITGYTLKTFQDKVNAKKWYQLIHPEDRPDILALLHKAKEKKIPFHCVYRIRTKDKQYKHVEETGSYFYNTKGVPIRVTGIIKDITEYRKTQRALFRTERLKSVAELAAGVSHNFNNLLQAVLGCARLGIMNLEMGNTVEATELFKKIIDSANSGARTVSKLQSFSNMKEDSMWDCEETIDVAKVIEKCIDISQPRWKTEPEKNGIFINVTKKLEPKLLVKMKESDLIEVIVNLINNAVDAMPDGGSLDFKVYRDIDFNKVAIEIKDTGSGINDMNKSYIFEPFWTTKGDKGTGLGLASSIGIISSYNGELNVDSEPGSGATFTILLPLAENVVKFVEQTDTVVLPKPLSILVVDDQEVIASMYSKGFEMLGHLTYYAMSGSEALPIVFSHQLDVILCDLAMPEMNGWQIGKAVKDYFESYKIPKPLFIMLTGWNVNDQLDEIKNSGVDLILQKPVELKSIVVEIDNHFKKKGKG